MKKLKNYTNKNYRKGEKYLRNILEATWIGNVKKNKRNQVWFNIVPCSKKIKPLTIITTLYKSNG